MACECGCGFEGEDDLVQFCVEEAVMERLHWTEKLKTVGGGGLVDESAGMTPFEQAQAEHERMMREVKGS